MSIRNVYNKLAKSYDLRHENPFSQIIRKKERKFLKFAKGATLDVGCGTGYHLSLLKKSIGIDVSEEMLRIARKNSKVIQAGSARLPFIDESFETVVCMFSVLNMCNWGSTIKEISRVMKDGGICITSVASIYDNHYSFCEKIRGYRCDRKKIHIQKQKLIIKLFEKEEIIREFEKNGMKLDRFDSLFIYQNPRWGDFTPLSVIERLKLFSERIMPLKKYGCMYFFVFKKVNKP